MSDDSEDGPKLPWEPGAVPWWIVAVTDDDKLDPEQLARLFSAEELVRWLETLQREHEQNKSGGC
jgi:hypothetical protein